MKQLETIAREINRMKEDPQDWDEFVTDFLCVVVTVFLAAFTFFLMWNEII